MKIKVGLLFYFFCMSLYAQPSKSITLEDIWIKKTYEIKNFEGFQWMRDGKSYSKIVHDHTKNTYTCDVFDVVSGKRIKTIFTSGALIVAPDSLPIEIDAYIFSNNESWVLIKTETESIYRYSDKAVYYALNIKSKKLHVLSGGAKISNADFSPDSRMVAYCKENNLFYTELGVLEDIKITFSGEKNKIIHGSSDWVYEEELELVKAFYWSPDSKKIAYYTFDETQVKEYNMQVWGELYPKDHKFKYPKAGEKNAEVMISIYSLNTGNSAMIFDGRSKDSYVPSIQWTANTDLLSLHWLNRAQDTLKIWHIATDGTTKLAGQFTDSNYVEVPVLYYLSNDKGYICTSEADGYRHIYHFDMQGRSVRQLTTGPWEVGSIVAVDEKKGQIFYTSKEQSSVEEHLYVIGIDGRSKRKLTDGSGVHQVELNNTCQYYVQAYNNQHGLVITLNDAATGKKIRPLEENKAFTAAMQQQKLGDFNFGIYTNASGLELNYWMIKPVDFDSTRHYPLFMFVYGGPGSQEVLRLWNRKNYLWYQMLAQKGYMIVCLDNRGTGGKGAAFKKCTTKQLGKLESEDQIAFARYLGTKPFVDKSRIGIWGWSYGGYMSSLCLFLGNDVFKLGIAVAPVTSWRFYDTIYTERFLKNPKDNTAGYDQYSPIMHAQKLKGKFLLIHGTGDDNVHFQNAVALQNALIKSGKQFSSFYYPNKSHGIGGSDTRLHLYKMMTEFLDKNL